MSAQPRLEPGSSRAPGLILPEEPEALKLGVSPSAGINGDEAQQAAAGERFRIFIEPFINPERCSELYRRFPRKTDLLEHIAGETGISQRQIRRMLERWEESGLAGLTRSIRLDKGVPRSLNKAAQDFILKGALPQPGVYGKLTVRDIFRAYEEERRWRSDSATRQLTKVETARYKRYVSPQGYLLPEAQLPEASYETFRRWFARIPEVVKVMARDGNEAFHNTQEILSFRDLTALQPLDYVDGSPRA